MRIVKFGLPMLVVAGWVAIEAVSQKPQAEAQVPPPRERRDDGPDGPPGPPPPRPPDRLFEAIDTDHDGELSAKEIAKAPTSILSLDDNKDGKLTEEELFPGGPPPPPPPGGPGRPGGARPDPKAFVASIMKFDKDGDGKVTAKELPERMSRLLEDGDADEDGALSRSEIETLSRRPPPRRPGPPGGGPPPRPPGRDDF